MTLYTEGQVVTYKGRKWIITGFGVDVEGRTTFYLKRGCYRTTAKESEVE